MTSNNCETVNSKIADPGPLGLACFALTTFCLSMINAGFIEKGATIVVIALALIYGGATQILAGMWEFKKDNVFGATAFASYGAFWLSLGCFDLLAALHLVAVPSAGVWLFLLAWTVFTFYMWIGSFGTTKALNVTFSLLLAAFILLTIGATGNETAHKYGGYVGILTAIAAWYTSAAGICNTVFGRVILPVGPAKN